MRELGDMRVAAFVWEAFVLHVGDAIVTDMHALAAVEVVVGFGGPLTVRGEDGEELEGGSFVVGPNVRHALYGGPFAMLWIEPESDAGRRLIAAHCRRRAIARLDLAGLDVLARSAAALLDAPQSCDSAWRLSMGVVAAVTGELPQGRPVPPAIRKAVRLIEAQPQSKISAKQLAEAVALSTGRLTHLFGETMGVPLRRYLMWQRLRRAVVILTNGGSAIQAAHDAGFTDTAHLTRVLKSMMGVRPSDLQAIREASGLTMRVCSRPRRGS